jgi:hypothetical protein
LFNSPFSQAINVSIPHGVGLAAVSTPQNPLTLTSVSKNCIGLWRFGQIGEQD